MRIAYLEDDPDQGALVTLWLRNTGHECVLFATGAAFMESLDHWLPGRLPDLVLLG